MPGARVRWRSSDEQFDVVGHGSLWQDDDESIIGAVEVAAQASLTELRRALERYRATMYDRDLTLRVYDTSEELLGQEPELFSPLSLPALAACRAPLLRADLTRLSWLGQRLVRARTRPRRSSISRSET